MRRNEGSLLIVALVTVMVVTSLSLSLALWVRSQIADRERNDLLREGRRGCYNGAQVCCFERLSSDTNGYDSLDEEWTAPFERISDGWVWRVSATGWNGADESTRRGLVDESARISLNEAPAPLLAALLVGEGIGEDEAAGLAARIVDWRDQDEVAADGKTPERAAHGLPESQWRPPNDDFRAVGDLVSVPGITREIFQAIAPYLTVHPVGQLNINTTSPAVLLAHFNASGARDSEAAASLFQRFRTFRHDGNHFESTDPGLMGRMLGPLTTEESLILSVLSTNISVRSEVFSGIVESFPAGANGITRPARARFTFDRGKNRFLRWVEE